MQKITRREFLNIAPNFKIEIDGVPHIVEETDGARKVTPVEIVNYKNERFQSEFITPEEEVTEGRYIEMLEVLPPARWCGGAFLVGEPVDHIETSHGLLAVYYLYYKHEEKYFYGGLTTTIGFDGFCVPVLCSCGAYYKNFTNQKEHLENYAGEHLEITN